MHKTAVVILNWNGLNFLKQFIGDVILYSKNPDTVVCVADNGSTDGSIEWLRSEYPEVRILDLGSNSGFAGGYNRALSMIQARYFVLLNSDIRVTENWLTPLVEYMDEHPDTASCQPRILSYSKPQYFEHAGAAGCFLDKYGYPFCRGRIIYHIEKDEGQYNDRINVFWSSGACMIVRAGAWMEAGGFDPSFFAHMEEIDLCWRFSRMGYKVAFIPDSVVYHIGGGTLPYTSPEKIYLNFRNSLFMLYKNLPDNKLQKTLFIRKLLDGLAGLMFLVKGDTASMKAVLRAHMDYYRSKKELIVKRKEVQGLGKNTSDKYILNKSIIFEFYLYGRKKFDLINWK